MNTQEWELQSGLKFNMDVPATVAEFDANAKREGACLEAGIADVAYRGFFANVRDLLADKAEEKFPNIAREKKAHPKTKNADGTPKMINAESPGKYLDRVSETLGDTGPQQLQSLLDELMAANAALADDNKDKIKFDASKAARVGGGANLVGKGDLEMAATILGSPEDKRTAAIAKIESTIGRQIVLTNPDGTALDADTQKRALGLGIKDYRAAMAKSLLS